MTAIELADDVVRASKAYCLEPTIAGKLLLERAIRRYDEVRRSPHAHCAGCENAGPECGLHKICRRFE